MLCDSCEQLLTLEGAGEPHSALALIGKAGKLRPMLRRPILINRYRCRGCGANWIHEVDPQTPGRSSWVCLGGASSILEPRRLKNTSEPTGQVSGH